MEYKYNKDFKVKKENENYIIYNDNNNLIFDINEFGYEIIKMLENDTEIVDIIELFQKEYQEDIEVIKDGVMDFINSMALLNIIELENFKTPTTDELEYVENIDVDSYLHLRKIVGWEVINRNQACKSINNSYYIVACRYKGETIGMARVMWDGGYTAFIVDVIVDPIWQRKKIGTTMVKKLENKLYNSLESGDRLMINLYSSKDKYSFYSGLGFEKGLGFIKWINK